MFKIEWQNVLKQWVKTVIQQLLPIFGKALIELFQELIETYNKDNIKAEADIREAGAYILQEQKKKLNNEPYDESINGGYTV